MSKQDHTEELSLPEPGQTYVEGNALKRVTFIVSVDPLWTKKTTKGELQEQLRTYGLAPLKGNKDCLLKILREFSKDESAWLSIFQPVKKRKRERNSHGYTVTVEAKAILSACGVDPDLREAPAPSKRRRIGLDASYACASSAQVCREGQHADQDLPTSQASVWPSQKHCQETLAVRIRRVEHNVSSVRDDILEHIDSIENSLTNKLHELVSSINLTTLPHRDVLTPSRSPALQVEYPSQLNPHQGTSGLTSSTTVITAPGQLPMPMVVRPHSSPQVPISSELIPKEHLGIARLDNIELAYDKRHVPNPPAIHFSQDIDRLCREWENSTLLVVNGHGIPIKHWGQFYKKTKGVKGSAWQAIRVEWGNWKFIAEEQRRYPNAEAFWRTFSSEGGQRLAYQQILDRLSERRAALAAQDAANARSFFSNNLDHPSAHGAFRYVKGGKSYILTKDDAITRAWHQLLTTQPHIAVGWAAFCAGPSTSS
ncbi:hypothetical protein PAXINDRAFT_182450 [Paxillus involutus ATCC 200175]|uniref:SAP domain-containing protein n=1 Tax=Paxillus involutus ATCC 200175 TaxID=664439 RepID=A0A0C9TJP8_PAXIN|nr:hypothetical protein PAXINDRAFT_182450 [Paxillus involutus ATCC 200175]